MHAVDRHHNKINFLFVSKINDVSGLVVNSECLLILLFADIVVSSLCGSVINLVADL